MNFTFIEAVATAQWQKTMNLAFKSFVEMYRKFYNGHLKTKF